MPDLVEANLMLELEPELEMEYLKVATLEGEF